MIGSEPTDPLPIYEGLTQWGWARITPEHGENLVHLELKRLGKDEVWKPLFSFVALDGRIVFRTNAENNGRMVVYDATTNTFSDLRTEGTVRNNSSVRSREGG